MPHGCPVWLGSPHWSVFWTSGAAAGLACGLRLCVLRPRAKVDLPAQPWHPWCQGRGGGRVVDPCVTANYSRHLVIRDPPPPSQEAQVWEGAWRCASVTSPSRVTWSPTSWFPRACSLQMPAHRPPRLTECVLHWPFPLQLWARHHVRRVQDSL